jgi:hypothetical protein
LKKARRLGREAEKVRGKAPQTFEPLEGFDEGLIELAESLVGSCKSRIELDESLIDGMSLSSSPMNGSSSLTRGSKRSLTTGIWTAAAEPKAAAVYLFLT